MMENRGNCCICLENNTCLSLSENERENFISKLIAVIPEIYWPETFSICEKCSEELNAAFNFRTKCLESHEKFTREGTFWNKNKEQNNVLENDCDLNFVKKEADEVEKHNENSLFSPKHFENREFSSIFVQNEDKDPENICEVECDINLVKFETGCNEIDPTISPNIEEGNEDKHLNKIFEEQFNLNTVKIESVYNEIDRIDSTFSLNDEDDDDGNDSSYLENEGEVQNSKCETATSTKNDPWVYTCQCCSQTFDIKRELMTHCEKIHNLSKNEIKPYSCPECKKHYTSSTILKRHLKYHKPRTEICNICSKAFYLKSDLKIHEKIHINPKEYSCESCNKSFTTHKTLKLHKLSVHTDPSEWNYVCSYCNKRFFQKCTMNIHTRIHTGEKLFECHVCQMKFTRNSHLIRHHLKHSYVRNYQCNECGEHFKDVGTMKRHKMRIHGIGKK